jgi:hypothetical protein
VQKVRSDPDAATLSHSAPHTQELLVETRDCAVAASHHAW